MLIRSDIAVTDAGIPSRIMKKADAGCPPVADGVIAEKKISADEYRKPLLKLVLLPRKPVRYFILTPSVNINKNMHPTAATIQKGLALTIHLKKPVAVKLPEPDMIVYIVNTTNITNTKNQSTLFLFTLLTTI